MPEISKSYTISNLSASELSTHCRNILEKMGGQNFEEEMISENPFAKKVKAFFPSIWGWGGMNLTLEISSEDQNSKVNLKGYIAQLSMSPLTKKMDEFLTHLSQVLKDQYQYNFEFEKLSRFVPRYQMKVTNQDKTVLTILLILSFIMVISSFIFNSFIEILIGLVIVWLSYFIGKKFIYKKE